MIHASNHLKKACLSATVFVVAHIAIYVSGYRGLFNVYVWQGLSVLSYFPLSIFVKIPIDKLAKNWFSVNPGLLIATSLTEGVIGAIWWFAISYTYSKKCARR